MNARRLPLLLLAAAIGPSLRAQDFTADVQKACTHPRLGLRLAASRKVAEAGDAAVPALRAFAAKQGQDRIPVALVEAIAEEGGDGEAVCQLLEGWAEEATFYWRAQALRGLAVRAPRLPAQRAHWLALFQRQADDPAWLSRVFARFGLELLRAGGDVGAAPAPETDPRAQSKLAALLLASGQVPPLQPLLDALADDRSFLGDPWGRRRGLEAFKALSDWLGDRCDFALDAAADQNQDALERLRGLAAAKSKQALQLPAAQRDPVTAFAGGIELFSCRTGDLYLRWTAGGEVHVGLTDDSKFTLPSARWQALVGSAHNLTLPSESGVVICDKLRLVLENPTKQGMIAPTAMPAAILEWLKQFAAAIEEAGDRTTADALRHRLEQFTAR